MSLVDALKVVRELAQENALDRHDCDNEAELLEMCDKQQEALHTVSDYISELELNGPSPLEARVEESSGMKWKIPIKREIYLCALLIITQTSKCGGTRALIQEGNVSIDGKVCYDPMKILFVGGYEISVSGKRTMYIILEEE